MEHISLKGIAAGALSCILAFSLVAYGGAASQTSSSSDSTFQTAAQDGSTATIEALDAEGNTIEEEVSKNPQRAAILDLAPLDIIDSLGEGDSVVASASTDLNYFQKYMTDPNASNIGTIKEPDMEAVATAEPDIIFIGGRLPSYYDQLAEIALVVYLADDLGDNGVYAGTKRDAEQIAKTFSDEDKVAPLFTDFDARITKLQQAALT